MQQIKFGLGPSSYISQDGKLLPEVIIRLCQLAREVNVAKKDEKGSRCFSMINVKPDDIGGELGSLLNDWTLFKTEFD